MAPAWKVGWVKALKGSNPLFSASKSTPVKGVYLFAEQINGVIRTFAGNQTLGNSWLQLPRLIHLVHHGLERFVYGFDDLVGS